MLNGLRDVMNGTEAREVSDATSLVCSDKSLCRRSEQDDADINVIIERMRIGYEVPTNLRRPVYADFSEAMNFEESMNAIRAAQVSFMALPGKVRAEFGNDPQRFLDFCEERDSEGRLVNEARMLKLGLAVAPEAVPEAPVMKVEVVGNPVGGVAGPVVT